ncbi:MAG: SDR family NAD(P)-dependent oxidoreductase [Actinomycetota bacterium]|nr:SDR family NAD(P)-dependent oxidoreductase [Actinomycetota bacterium]
MAIVTGAASGIGKATLSLFAKEGAKIILSDINFEDAEKVAQKIIEEGGEATPVLTDVFKPEDVDKMIETAVTLTEHRNIL